MGCKKLSYYDSEDTKPNFLFLAKRGLEKEGTAEKKCLNYYPFGSPLPGRNQVSSPSYEHGYQGQFTMNDEETGLDAFEP